MVRCLPLVGALAVALLAPAEVRGQTTRDAAVALPNPAGCTTPSAEVVQASQTLLGVTSTKFDFKTISHLWPLTAQSVNRQSVCVALKEQMPPEDAWERVLFFESDAYYVGMTQLVEPDPDELEIVTGLVTIAVFRKDLTKLTAFSF